MTGPTENVEFCFPLGETKLTVYLINPWVELSQPSMLLTTDCAVFYKADFIRQTFFIKSNECLFLNCIHPNCFVYS